jgi:hypothetical protein
MVRLWDALLAGLRPDFGDNTHQRDLSLTFRLLVAVLKIMLVLIALWAIAAGVLQTGRLIKYIPQGFPGQGAGFWAQQTGWLAPVIGVPAYTLMAFGVTTLVGVAAGAIGGILGFLFALPRPPGEGAAYAGAAGPGRTQAPAGASQPVANQSPQGAGAPIPSGASKPGQPSQRQHRARLRRAGNPVAILCKYQTGSPR